jgi:hypothetical protein
MSYVLWNQCTRCPIYVSMRRLRGHRHAIPCCIIRHRRRTPWLVWVRMCKVLVGRPGTGKRSGPLRTAVVRGGSRKAYHNYPVEVGTVQYSTVQYNYMGNGRRDGAISREGATMRRTREGRGWEERFSSEGIYSVSLLQREYILSLSLSVWRDDLT